MTRILILHSANSGPCGEYIRPMIPPPTLDIHEADQLAKEIIEEVRQSDDWSWEDIEDALVKAGFEAVNWQHGCYWDD